MTHMYLFICVVVWCLIAEAGFVCIQILSTVFSCQSVEKIDLEGRCVKSLLRLALNQSRQVGNVDLYWIIQCPVWPSDITT